MGENRCIICYEIIPEGRIVCPMCHARAMNEQEERPVINQRKEVERTMINWKNILSRAAWTFLEAFLIALPATISTDTFAGAAWKSVLLSAACAGLSAVKTLIVETIQQNKKSWIQPEE